MTKFTRRQFIKTSGSAIAGASLAPLAGLKNLTVAPSDTVNVALIGCRSMGFGDLTNAINVEGVNCIGLCDVDQNVLEDRAADVEQMTGSTPQLYGDYRKLLENPDLDAVIIGTPDHWHCLQTVHALEAGKHVYVEKPLANNIAEINVMKKAANYYGHVVQVGQQQRSGAHWQHVVDLVQSGHLGKIRQVDLWGNFGYGVGANPVEDSPVPEGVDYDMWLGPAPDRAFNQNRYHGSWRFFWHYGGGVQTDWGVHLLDIALWAMEIDGMPHSVHSIGGIFSGMDRAIEMADTQTTTYAFDDFNMEWKHTGGLEMGPYNRHYGIAFVGNKGTLVVNRDSWEIIPVEGEDDQPLVERVSEQGDSSYHDIHAKNFIESIRGNETEAAPIEAGHLAAMYAHLGNLSYQTGDTLKFYNTGQLVDESKYMDIIKPDYRNPWTFPSV
ncbi:Gfo/Idh/MocA family oxidoreductase [Rhodohalobacter sulfatireducens]|uniref:Gfo/Idh/MocA family oxidoreductase n=1 Tax=Rhodohalobacter sulfatireducens TaxID=2911366 RepID=A0ABS9KEZ0_9BACT|nr:Gfo/Idh/MocA family oxidoreductase [Rhodohalobacter sulfatireducens]MCG2589420.1 Gfo/Idh/MocA family oxidoreductase [Rhodohalobacter sulfatireducens]MDR9363703.1 Gfo/Idh/MocA family oxidoreductase [Balneolaceae bacterium]MDR9408356.1 Gfo/Idh/MocA family oxidoreductase [Balneolaceae bacterium]